MTNSIRPGGVGEPASQWRSPDPEGKPVGLKGNVSKPRRGPSGDWRRNDRKGMHVKQGDLYDGGESYRSQSAHSSDDVP